MILHWSVLLFFIPLILSFPLSISFKFSFFSFSFWLVSIYNMCTTSNKKYRNFLPHNSVQQFRQSAYIILIHFISLSVIFIIISSQAISKLILINSSQSQLSLIALSQFGLFFQGVFSWLHSELLSSHPSHCLSSKPADLTTILHIALLPIILRHSQSISDNILATLPPCLPPHLPISSCGSVSWGNPSAIALALRSILSSCSQLHRDIPLDFGPVFL